MIDLHNQNPEIDDYEYLYNEWLKQFEPDKKIKVKKFKADKNDRKNKSNSVSR